MKVDPISSRDFQPQQQGNQQQVQQFTNEQKRNELAREINLRNTVYPGMVRSGRLTQENADRQLAILRSIWEEYGVKAQEDKERTQPALQFGERAQGGGEQMQPAQPGEAKPEQPGDAPAQPPQQPKPDALAEQPSEQKGAQKA
jgi:hypothetical protein